MRKLQYSIAPELVCNEKVTNLVDVYSFGCMVNEIMSGKFCYHDYRGNVDNFYIQIKKGMRPAIDSNLPQGTN